MIITIEISHYPLNENYEENIINFIETLKTSSDLKVYTNAMSTYVKGDDEVVFEQIKQALRQNASAHKISSTVLKIIPKNIPIEDGYLRF